MAVKTKLSFPVSFSRRALCDLIRWCSVCAHLCLGTQILLHLYPGRQFLGDLQFLDVSSRGSAQAGDGGHGSAHAARSSSRSAARGREVLHTLLRVEHALDLLVDLRTENTSLQSRFTNTSSQSNSITTAVKTFTCTTSVRLQLSYTSEAVY